jgi:hypothetical protein
LNAIADAAETLERKGTNPIDVTNFIQGAREKLAEERPDPETYAKAATSAYKWAKTNA